MEHPLSKTDWQDIFDKAMLKASQLRAGIFYIPASQGNHSLHEALLYQEARAAEAAHQLAQCHALAV